MSRGTTSNINIINLRDSEVFLIDHIITVDDLDYRNVDDGVGVILQEVTSLIAVLPSGALISNSGHVS